MEGPSNNDIMFQYLSWCKDEKRFSKDTILTYMSAISAFISFLKTSDKHLTQTTLQDAKDYLINFVDRHDKNKDITKISINDYRTVLKSFFDYLVKSESTKENPSICINPFQKTSRLKEEKPKRDVLTVDELERLINKVNGDGTFLFRDTIMFELFWNSGLRTSELSDLEAKHLSLVTFKDKKTNKLVTIYELKVVQGKGGKDRIVPVSTTTTYMLKKYLQGYKLRFPTSDHLFPNNHGNKMHRRQVYGIIEGFLNLTHTTKKKGAHVLRHTYATLLMNSGANILTVKKMLGHSSVKTTAIYAKPSDEFMKAEHNKAHPKGDKNQIKRTRKKIPTIKRYVMEREQSRLG
jgi:site-specific recombinase XerD